MLQLFNDFSTVLINSILQPCFGVEWKAWTLLLTILVFVILITACIILAVKYNKANTVNNDLTDRLNIISTINNTKSTQINQLTETLAIKEGEIKTLKLSNSELETSISVQKEEHEKEVSQLKSEITQLKHNVIDLKKELTEQAKIEATKAEENTEVLNTETIQPSVKKKASKKKAAKKTAEEIVPDSIN
jgi:cell division protein FtsB